MRVPTCRQGLERNNLGFLSAGPDVRPKEEGEVRLKIRQQSDVCLIKQTIFILQFVASFVLTN